MTADANVTDSVGTAEAPADPPADTAMAPPQQKRTWSMPKSPVTRQQVDQAGRGAAKATVTTAKAVGKAVACLARYGARVVVQTWRAIEGVPIALRSLGFFAVLTLLGVVGSIALAGTAGLLCSIIVVPVCAIAVGALGQRWFSGRHGEAVRRPEATSSDLERSVAYVDTKLTLALNSLGSVQHQQAVIALFQAKTAVELALGTERQTAELIDVRPRIRAGSGVSQSDSLAAS